jgi:lipid-A-disaccharide synthase
MAQIKRIFIICGEPSGDLLAGNLISAMKKLDPAINISAVGGTHLESAGAEILYDIKGLAVMGFFDVLRKLPKFLKLKRLILEKINADKPDAIIFVDFSGFNLRLAQAINKRVPSIYYVSPQVWASREGRVKYIRKFITKMIVLFKFEEEFYRQRGIQAVCAGHPLIDIVKPTLQKQKFIDNFRLSEKKKTIALLPGSRKQEIKLILPIMLKASRLINKQIPDTQFIIAKSPQLDAQIYQDECKMSDLDIKIVDGKTYDCLKIAEASLVCSGTATLEAAIMQKPFVIVYKMNLLNYLLYRPQIKIPYIGMVNIVAGRKIVPEFIQFNANPKKIADSIIKFLQEPEYTNRIIQDLKIVKTTLGEPGAAGRAAKLILDFIYP